MKRAFVFSLMLTGSAAVFAALPAPPHLGVSGRSDFLQYLAALPGKAFAVAPGGAWGWAAAETDVATASEVALSRCQSATEQHCILYAEDERRIFDERRWRSLWHLPPAEPAGNGLGRGARFPDLEYRKPDGRPGRLSELRSKVVVLHFWGSWCAPCRHEFPDLAQSAKRLASHGVIVVPLQVRESISDARAWVTRQGIALPLYDSGITGLAGSAFRVTGGGTLPDRAVAPLFPSTVVIDRKGRVVFSHHGPIERWAEYEDLLKALAK